MFKLRNILVFSLLLTFFSQLFVFERAVASQAQNSSAQAMATDFAKKLLDLPDEAAREKALIDASPSLVNADLVKALLRLGSAFQKEEKYAEALRRYTLAESVAMRIWFKEGQARAIFQQGEIYSDDDQNEKANGAYERALGMFADLGQAASPSKTANIEERTGLQYYKVFGKYRRGAECFQKAWKKHESAGDEKSAQRVLNLLGETYKFQGRYEEAQKLFQEVLRRCKGTNNAEMLPDVLHNLGVVFSDLGDYREAIAHLQTSYKLIPPEDADFRSASLAYQGAAYHFQGNYDQAFKVYRQILEIKKGDKLRCGQALKFIGSIFLDVKDLGQARANLLESKALLENNEDARYKEALAGTLYYLGRLSLIERKPKSAQDFFQKVYELDKDGENKYNVGTDLCNLALSFKMLGNLDEAHTYSEKAVAVHKELGTPYGIWSSKSVLGEICRLQGRNDEARRAFEEAISVIENGRIHIAGDPSGQRQYFADKAVPYHGLMKLSQAEGKTDAAFACAEQFKARVLQDVLQSGRINVTHAMTEAEKEEERRVRAALTSATRQLSKAREAAQPNERQISELEEKRRQARLECEAFQINLYAAHPELKTQRGESAPIDHKRLAAFFSDETTAVIEYVVTNDETYAFVITGADGKRTGLGEAQAPPSLSVHRIPIARDELERSVQAFHDRISHRDLNVDEPARKLYDILLKPAAELLTGRTTLIVVPDGPLWELPFNALKSPSNRFLIEDAAISYAPSLTALYEMRRLSNRPMSEKTLDVLAFGDPSQSLPHGKASRQGKLISESRLPDAKQEAKTVANLFRPRGRALIGERANENNFRKLSGAARILHIATHGVVDNVNPMYSHVLLAEEDPNHDGRLEAWEIADMDINADLVTLSACETAGGKFSQGEGIVGLSWAFFIAGCRSALVSQWKVESRGTAELMIEFYRRYSKRNGDAGISKTESLRSASLKMLKNREYAHPFYWAGFALIGDER